MARFADVADTSCRLPGNISELVAQVLDKGIPDGVMPGIAGRQVQLKDDENMIPGLLNAQGNKVPHESSCALSGQVTQSN